MQPPPRPEESELRSGEVLRAGQCIVSPTGRQVLAMQRDGNLVLYDRGNNGVAYWATNSSGSGADHVTMQGDGNVVLARPNNSVVWSTLTDPAGGWHGGPMVRGSYWRLQEDGNLVLYRSAPEIGVNAAWDVETTAQSHSVLSSVEDDLSGAVGAVINVVHDIPGVDWAGDELKDFAGTTFGQWFLRILAGSVVYTGLAPYLGPQLASVGFALPGVAKGDKFASAWTQEEIWRISETAKALAGQAAQALSDAALQAFQPYLDAVKNAADELEDTANRMLAFAGGAAGISALISRYVAQFGVAASAHLAADLSKREDFVVATIDGALNTDSFWRPAKPTTTVTDVTRESLQTRPFGEHAGKVFDPLTGAEVGLTVPQGALPAGAPPPHPPKGSRQAWISYYDAKGPLPQ